MLYSRVFLGLLLLVCLTYSLNLNNHDACQPCPTGWSDLGAYCKLPEYARKDYIWQRGDPFNSSGMKKRCEDDHGAGNCEMWNISYYPKCKPGYYAYGCCICRPLKPNCISLGLNPGSDVACAKKC